MLRQISIKQIQDILAQKGAFGTFRLCLRLSACFDAIFLVAEMKTHFIKVEKRWTHAWPWPSNHPFNFSHFKIMLKKSILDTQDLIVYYSRKKYR